MTRDQAYIRACDEVNKTRPLTDAEVDRLCAIFDRQNARKQLAAEREARAARQATNPVYARRMQGYRRRYRTDPAYRDRKIAYAKARQRDRKGRA